MRALADAALGVGQDQGDGAVAQVFLVLGDGVEKGGHRHRMTLEAAKIAGEDGMHPGEVILGADSQAGGHEVRHVHADGDGDAVGNGEPGRRLEGVAEGVAVIEDIARPPVEFVFLDVTPLDFERAPDEPLHRRRVPEQVGIGDGDFVESGRAFNGVDFEHLAETRAHVALVEGIEEAHVHDHPFGRREGAEDVLGLAAVDRAFRADAGIGLGQQRGRIEPPRHSPEQRRGEKANDILNNTPADGDQHMVAAHALRHQALDVGGKAIQRLGLFGRVEEKDGGQRENISEATSVHPGDARVHDRVKARRRLRLRFDPARLEPDLVRAPMRADFEPFRHG